MAISLGVSLSTLHESECVWFGYRLVGEDAWKAAFPHLILYAAAMMGLQRDASMGMVCGLCLFAVHSSFRVDVYAFRIHLAI